MKLLVIIVAASLILLDQSSKLLLVTIAQSSRASAWLNLIIVTTCITLCRATPSRPVKFGLLLIMLGGVSNTIDLLYIGHIRDVITVYRIDTNIADIEIILGCLTIIAAMILPKIFTHSEHTT